MADLTAAERVRKVVRERLADGQYPPGTRLPSDHALAEEFGVHVQTVGNALRPLRADGMIRHVKGYGTHVADPNNPAGPVSPLVRLEQAVRKRLQDSTYKPLTWLPPLRVLGAEFGISPPSANNALAPLKAEKLLDIATADRKRLYVIDPQQPSALPEGARQPRVRHRLMTPDVIRKVIEERLADGTYSPGTVLPSQTNLADEFGVSSKLVDVALRPLKNDGILHAVTNRGTVVLDPKAPAPVSYRSWDIEQIIRARLDDGTYAAGTWIPPLRDLAAEFRVTCPTIHKVLTALKQDKLLDTFKTAGTYVVDPRRPGTPPSDRPSRTAAFIEQTIRERLRAGTYPPSTLLPSATQLGAEFGVHQATVTKALGLLRKEGLLVAGSQRGELFRPPSPGLGTAQNPQPTARTR